MTDTDVRIRAIISELSLVVLERREEIEAVIIALLAKQHGIMFGPTGTAKSFLLESVAKRFPGARYGRWLMDPRMDKSDLLGMQDIAEYGRTGKWERDISDTLGDVHIALLDEAEKTGAGTTTPILTALHERMVKPGKSWIPIPLLSAFGACNAEINHDQAAFFDRFPVRLVVDYIVETGNFIKMLKREQSDAEPTTVSLEELLTVVETEVPAVTIPDGIYRAMADLRKVLADCDIIPSDRRWSESTRLLQAAAWLNGRSVVMDGDLGVLRHVLWDTFGQRDEVRRIVMERMGASSRGVLELSNALIEINVTIANMDTHDMTIRAQEAMVLNGKLVALSDRVRREVSNEAERDTMLAHVRESRAQLTHVALGTPLEAARRAMTA